MENKNNIFLSMLKPYFVKLKQKQQKLLKSVFKLEFVNSLFYFIYLFVALHIVISRSYLALSA